MQQGFNKIRSVPDQLQVCEDDDDNDDDDDDDYDNNNNNNNNNIIIIQRMWSVKIKVIPAIVQQTGTISKSFTEYLSKMTGMHEIKELQKTVILGTAHIL